MKLKIFILLLTLGLSKTISAQNFFIEGTIKDLQGNNLEDVGVFLKNTAFFTYTNDTGYFKFQVNVGTFTLYLKKDGYENYTSQITIVDGDLKLNYTIKSIAKEIGAVVIRTKKIDFSREIMQKVVSNKQKYFENNGYSCKMYIKASEKTQTSTKDSLKIKHKDTIQSGLAEIYCQLDVSKDGAIKEERLAVKKQGDITGLFWLSATDGLVNIYQNLIKMPNVSDVPMLSPASNAGLLSYNFKTENLWFENGKKYYRIGVSPVALGNALGEGYLIVEDTTYRVLRMALLFPMMHVPEYERFAIIQDYIYLSDSIVTLSTQEFIYNTKFGNTITYGETKVKFDSFNFNTKFGKKYFGDLQSVTSEEAYRKDTNFWNSIRADSLSELEYHFSKTRDSLKAVYESVVYKDSMQVEMNKVTLKKLFLTGQPMINHLKKRSIYIYPLAFSVRLASLGGTRIGEGFSYQKRYENKQQINGFFNFHYGLRNKDLKGNMYMFYMFNPINQSNISITLERDFELINTNDVWLSALKKSNFFERDRVKMSYGREFINGLYANAKFEFHNRRSIERYKFNTLIDSVYYAFGDSAPNKPQAFSPYYAFYTDINLSYTPRQKYALEPGEKIILGSKWPTFSINWRKGMPFILGSAIDFDYLGFAINQVAKLGLLGQINYRINTGKFLQRKDLRLVDYVFQPNSNPIIFSNPNYNFQRLDSTYRTLDWFYQGHILHRFNGAILNKIPLLKKLKLVETAGGGFLISPENNLRYAEAFVGIEKLVKIFNERFRVGIYAVAAQSNRFEAPIRLKFSVEYFNRYTNSWLF